MNSPRAKKMDRASEKDREHQWPNNRRDLFRPDRSKYILGQAKSRDCVFCAARKDGPSVSSLLIYETKYSMVILNKYPYNTGHLLVLPQEHGGDPVLLKEKAYL